MRGGWRGDGWRGEGRSIGVWRVEGRGEMGDKGDRWMGVEVPITLSIKQ